MPDNISARKVSIDSLQEYFKVSESERTDLESLKLHIRGLANPFTGTEAIVGIRMQNAVAAMSQTLALANITCDESTTEKPSKMDATYRGGKVVFRCYHNPVHEFEIDV